MSEAHEGVRVDVERRPGRSARASVAAHEGRRSSGPGPAPSRSRPRSAPDGPSTRPGSITWATATGSCSGRAVELGVGAASGSGGRSRAARRRPGPPGRRRGALRCRRREDRPVGDVEADHRHVDAAREDAARGLGVGPDVELGRRRPVPLADRAAHQHDPLAGGHPARARAGARRSSAARSARASPPPPARGSAARGTRRRARRGRRAAGGGSSGPSSPLSPWTCAATERLAHERVGRARPRPARPTGRRARAPSARSSVVFSIVWLPATVVTPSSSSSGEASASMSAIASS